MFELCYFVVCRFEEVDNPQPLLAMALTKHVAKVKNDILVYTSSFNLIKNIISRLAFCLCCGLY